MAGVKILVKSYSQFIVSFCLSSNFSFFHSIFTFVHTGFVEIFHINFVVIISFFGLLVQNGCGHKHRKVGFKDVIMIS